MQATKLFFWVPLITAFLTTSAQAAPPTEQETALFTDIQSLMQVSPSPAPSPAPAGVPVPEPTFGVSLPNVGPCEHVTAFIPRPTQDEEPLDLDTPVYIFDQDSPSESKCTGECANEWPPILAPNFRPPTLAPPLTETLGGTPILRSDGTLQNIYGGHPLYLFSGDLGDPDGPPTGHCRMAQGGRWMLLKPDGTPCPCETATAPAPAPAPPPPPQPSSCGPYTVCGWTPGWKCKSFSPSARNHCNSNCCWYAGAHSECPGDNFCGGSCAYRCVYDVTDANCVSDCYGYSVCDFCNRGGGGGGGCGPYTVCGWTPGWQCFSNSPGFRDHCNPGCCWNAGASQCTGDSACG